MTWDPRCQNCRDVGAAYCDDCAIYVAAAHDEAKRFAELIKPAEDHGCSPGHGGLGGVAPWCRACGVMTPPMARCTRSDCAHRIIG